MNVKEQLKINSKQFVDCFYTDDKFLAVRILIFIVTGFSALIFYLVNAILLFLIRIFQIPGEELDCFIKDESKPAILRSVFLIIVMPIAYLRYILLPFFYMIYWGCNFFFNCFVFISSLGKSGWSELSFN